jgi:hypothetical protein
MEENVKIDIQEVGWGHGLDRSGPEQEQMAALVNAAKLSGLLK